MHHHATVQHAEHRTYIRAYVQGHVNIWPQESMWFGLTPRTFEESVELGRPVKNQVKSTTFRNFPLDERRGGRTESAGWTATATRPEPAMLPPSRPSTPEDSRARVDLLADAWCLRRAMDGWWMDLLVAPRGCFVRCLPLCVDRWWMWCGGWMGGGGVARWMGACVSCPSGRLPSASFANGFPCFGS